MEYLVSLVDGESVKKFLGDAAASEYLRITSMFALAAFVHAKQVRKEIKEQFGILVSVLKEDLEAQKNTLGLVGNRVSKIEKHLHMEE